MKGGTHQRSGYDSPMPRWTVLAALCLLAAACSPAEPAPSTTTTAPVSTTTTAQRAVDPCVSGDLEFDADGLIAALGESLSDATQIDGIRWDDHGSCERITLSFTTDRGAPAATLGVTGVTVLALAGIVRITLPDDVSGSAVADMLVDGDIARSAYVVSDVAGKLLVDIHAAEDVPIAARAFTTDSPATLVVDLVTNPEGPNPAGASRSQTAVIVAPPSGPALYPFTVEAYAAPALRSTRIQLERSDVVAVDQTVSLPSRPDAWQLISVRIEDGPSGPTTLFVGQVDANDRPLEGARAVLDLP